QAVHPGRSGRLRAGRAEEVLIIDPAGGLTRGDPGHGARRQDAQADVQRLRSRFHTPGMGAALNPGQLYGSLPGSSTDRAAGSAVRRARTGAVTDLRPAAAPQGGAVERAVPPTESARTGVLPDLRLSGSLRGRIGPIPGRGRSPSPLIGPFPSTSFTCGTA